MKRITKNKIYSLICATMFGCLGTPSFGEVSILKNTAYKNGIAQKDITVGGNEILVSNEPIRRISIADPGIADVRVLSDTSAIIRGKQIGKTSIIIWEGKDTNARPQRFDLTVKRDISDLIANIKTIDPNINVDYVIIQNPNLISTKIDPQNGAYSTSYSVQPQQVGEPAPSLVVNQGEKYQGVQPADSAAEMKHVTESEKPFDIHKERIILTGKVKSAEVIAKAMAAAATYMGDTFDMNILVRSGGLINKAEGVKDLLVKEKDSGGGQEDGSKEIYDELSFATNLNGNINQGTIISSGSGRVISMLEVENKVQIAVKVRFYEIDKTRAKQFSSTLKYQDNQSIANGINLTRWLDTVAGVSNGAGAVSALFPKLNLFASLEALEASGAAKVLAEPTMVIASGEPGQFRVGGEIPVLEISTGSNQQTTTSIKYIPYGVSLNLLPSITENDSVLMNLRALTRELDSNSGITYSPTGTSTPLKISAFKTRKVTTQVEMDPNQALVIGGLIDSSSLQNVNKTPLLGDLPLIGAAFRGKEFEKSERELVIIISPEVVRGGNVAQMNGPLALESQINDNDYRFIPNGAEFGKRTSVQIIPPTLTSPTNGPVDLRKPSTMNDLDNVYR